MKPIETVERVATGYKEQKAVYTSESIREIFGDDSECLVIKLLDRLEAAENEIEAARIACGGFAGDPFDGSLVTAINAISMRCRAAEDALEELRGKMPND